MQPKAHDLMQKLLVMKQTLESRGEKSKEAGKSQTQLKRIYPGTEEKSLMVRWSS